MTEDGATIASMTAVQQHRGPDDTGFVAVDSRSSRVVHASSQPPVRLGEPADVLFGFNRLSILDLSPNGHQPMLDVDEQVILMMNGEVYNAFEFTAELRSSGYSFRGRSDTEVVLALYLRYGLDRMLSLLNGMFAIVIYDLRERTLHLARDRFGVKPLYVYDDASRFAFSSEIKSFLSLPGMTPTLAEDYISEFLLFRGTRDASLLKGVHNVPPGHVVSMDLDRKTYTQRRFAQPQAASEHYPRSLEETLQAAAVSQLIADVNVGTQLSGGVDSSLIAAYASQAMTTGDLQAISVTFSNQAFSEEPYVDQATAALGIRAHKTLLEPRYYFDKLETATWHLEQPMNHPNTVGIFRLSEHARNFVTVLLSGEGADELFAGYGRFVSLRRPYGRYLVSQLRHTRSNPLVFLSKYRDEGWRTVMATAYGSPALAAAMYPSFEEAHGVEERMSLYRQASGSLFDKQRAYEIQTYLPDLLMRQDKMSMAHSIENRVPFLDNQVAAEAMRLSLDDLLERVDGRPQGKAPLKRLAAREFGHGFAYRPKQGFGVPLRQFFQHERFQSLWHDVIEPGARARGIFEMRPVELVRSNLAVASHSDLEALWLMTSFELWASLYLDAPLRQRSSHHAD